MKKLLINLDACKNARRWAGALTDIECEEENISNQVTKSWKEIFETCPRGDWLLWLYRKTNKEDLRAFVLAKGHCANTVRHLMKDERSIKAVDTAIAFGNNNISEEELKIAAAAAYAAATAAAHAAADAYAAAAADAAAADAAADAAAHAADAAAAAAYAAATAAAHAAATAADAAADAADAAARRNNQQLTADICRKYLPIKTWNIDINL